MKRQNKIRIYSFIKRLFDIVASLMVIFSFLPIIFLIMILIKLESKGPALYKQERIGRDGRPFYIFKFRTLQIDYDWNELQKHLKEKFVSEVGKLGWEDYWKLKNDPRITKVGRFLRKTSLDELPKIFNVLKGDMSFVGPRAALPYEAGHYQDWERERLKCRPGITGLWQIGFEQPISFDGMIKKDIEYVRNQSFCLDLKILFKTVLIVMRS